ncbi:MAG: helix-turn-helix transcriptional regulator [Tyzzerella sp.]|nr:helix-turn-helix transcriptional regulator [Tyzzerella sp.]
MVKVDGCETHGHAHENLVHQIEDGMPNEETIRGLADFYKVFGDVTRIKILCALFQAESCVCGLAEAVGMTQSAVSHQLRLLKQMKLVKNRREGKTVYYSLADSHIQTILNQGMEHIRE